MRWFRLTCPVVLFLILACTSPVFAQAVPHRLTFPETAGALLILGGGKTPLVAYEEFFQLAGESEAHLIHIPTSSADFEANPDKIGYYAEWIERPKRSFRFLHTRSREEAGTQRFLQPLSQATGVWIGGGDQNHLVEVYGGTPLCDGLRDVLRRGGVVAGTSSGASIMSDYMIADEGDDSLWVGLGLGLCEQTIVDCHFTERQRFGRMLRLLRQVPQQYGIGIDERTALVIRGGQATVLGKGTVCFFVKQGSLAKPSDRTLHAGETASLAQLWSVPPIVAASPPEPGVQLKN